MDSEFKLSHKAKKRIKEVKRKARPGEYRPYILTFMQCESPLILLLFPAFLL